MKLRILLLAATMGALAPAACAPLDPLYRSGEWHPSHANDTDLVAMVANPADLVHGRQTAQVDGLQAAAAVARLRQDNVKQLPDSGLAELRLQASGAAANAAVPGAGGL